MEGDKVCNKYLDENYEHYVVEYRGEFQCSIIEDKWGYFIFYQR